MVGNRKLYKLVLDYKTERLVSSQAIFVYEPNDIQGAKKSKVKLKVKGNIKKFRQIKVEQFRQLLAEQCGGDIEYITEIGLQEGSVILYFQVPSKCKRHFCNLSQQQVDEWCRENGICSIWFDDEAVVEIPADSITIPAKYGVDERAISDVLKNEVHKVKQQGSFHKGLKIGGKSMLHLALELKHEDIVNHLILHGVPLDEVDQMRVTPLHMAVFLSYSHICQTLLKHSDIDIDAVDKFGNTALHIATCQGDYNLCTVLIGHGVSTNIENQDGKTAIDLAKDLHFTFLLLLTGEVKVDDVVIAVDEYALNCPICYCSFKQPQVLPCGHNFCSNCLETHWLTSSQKDSIKCPVCKQPAEIPEGDVAEFMLNIPLLQQVEEARRIQKWEKQKAKAEKESMTPVVDAEEEASVGSGPDLCSEVTCEESSENPSIAVLEGKSSEVCRLSKDSSDGSSLDVSSLEISREIAEMKRFKDTMPSSTTASDEGHSNEKSSVESGLNASGKKMTPKTVTPKKIENTSAGPVVHLTRVTRDSLTCRLCQERFKERARKLHCSHSFCESCLKAVVVAAKSYMYLICPSCDEETIVPKEGVIGLIHDINLDCQVDDANRYDERTIDGGNLDTIIDGLIDEERDDWELKSIADCNHICVRCLNAANKLIYLPCGHGCCENCIEGEQEFAGSQGEWQIICTSCKSEFSSSEVLQKGGIGNIKPFKLPTDMTGASFGEIDTSEFDAVIGSSATSQLEPSQGETSSANSCENNGTRNNRSSTQDFSGQIAGNIDMNLNEDKEKPSCSSPNDTSNCPSCAKCKATLETGKVCKEWICNMKLCVSCWEKEGHRHQMQEWKSPREARKAGIQRCIQSLVHACQCRDANCLLASCQKMKRVVQHTRICKRKTNGECPICKQLIALCCYHAKYCQETMCMVPFCLNIKHKLRQQQIQHRLQQAQALRRRLAAMVERTASTAQIPSQTTTPAASPMPAQQTMPVQQQQQQVQQQHQQMGVAGQKRQAVGPPHGAMTAAQTAIEAAKQVAALSVDQWKRFPDSQVPLQQQQQPRMQAMPNMGMPNMSGMANNMQTNIAANMQLGMQPNQQQMGQQGPLQRSGSFPPQALQQLMQVLKCPSSPHQQKQVLAILKSNPQLMAAFIKQRAQQAALLQLQQQQQQQQQQGQKPVQQQQQMRSSQTFTNVRSPNPIPLPQPAFSPSKHSSQPSRRSMQINSPHPAVSTEPMQTDQPMLPENLMFHSNMASQDPKAANPTLDQDDGQPSAEDQLSRFVDTL